MLLLGVVSHAGGPFNLVVAPRSACYKIQTSASTRKTFENDRPKKQVVTNYKSISHP